MTESKSFIEDIKEGLQRESEQSSILKAEKGILIIGLVALIGVGSQMIFSEQASLNREATYQEILESKELVPPSPPLDRTIVDQTLKQGYVASELEYDLFGHVHKVIFTKGQLQ